VLQTGNDPANLNLTYYVYQRSFANALVLYKPLSYKQGVGKGGLGPATATTVNLGGTYYYLNSDGTINQTGITSISLQNGWGAILMRSPSGGGGAMPLLASSSTSPVPGAGASQATPFPAASLAPPLGSQPVGPGSMGATGTVLGVRKGASGGSSEGATPAERAALLVALDAVFIDPTEAPGTVRNLVGAALPRTDRGPFAFLPAGEDLLPGQSPGEKSGRRLSGLPDVSAAGRRGADTADGEGLQQEALGQLLAPLWPDWVARPFRS
jgi:hypothetical protein